MKKQLLYLLPLFALCLGAVSIKWFNDYPAGRPLATNDIVAIQRTGPNRYVYGDLNDVKNLIGGGAQVWTNEGAHISPSVTLKTNPVMSYVPFLVGTNTATNAVATGWNLGDETLLSIKDAAYDVDNTAIYMGVHSNAAALTFVQATVDSEISKITLSSGPFGANDEASTLTLMTDPLGSDTGEFINISTNASPMWTIQRDGVMFNYYGSLMRSNDAPRIPAAVDLGAGGYWTGNSNGFLVTVYSLDGSSTVMKVLAP